ncbi:MAG: amino acid adenylation domain-containing protein, partial [Bifidobacteriaceae bacterium]|nr:amino acid adenylation domain-containing protein [Bifidobacteriaceae bacterium]
RDIFANPTPRALAALLGPAGPGGSAGSAGRAIPSAGGPGDYPLSSTQRRLEVLHRLDPESTAYNIPAAVRLTGPVDPARVERVWAQLIERHEALRTAFPLTPDGPVQRLAATAPARLELIQTPDLGPAALDRLIGRFVRPFDLSRPPLARLALATAAADQHLLLFDMHHTVSDATSMKLLLREFAEFYDQRPAPPVAAQPKDWDAWARARDLSAHRDYWAAQLEDPPAALDLPTDLPRPAVASWAGHTVRQPLSPDLRRAIGALAKRRGATDYAVLAAALAALLGKCARTEDLTIGTPVAGRTHRDAERAIGMFVGTQVLRARPRREMGFAELVDQMAAAAVGAVEHQDYPFESLVDQLAGPRDPARNPLFDVMLTLHNTEPAGARMDGVRVREVPIAQPGARFDLAFTVEEADDGGYDLAVTCRSDLFRQSTAQRLGRHFAALLADALARPEAPLASLSVLDAEERELTLAGFNATGAPHPGDSTLVAMMEDLAEADPEATALVWRGQPVSRAEVQRRAARVAARLRAAGIRPNQLVAVIADRRLELVIGLIGVLKSGGAFVPIDPDYPPERIARMLADSAPRAVLTAGPGLPPGVGEGLTVVDLEDPALAGGPVPDLPRVNRPSDLAYCLFTSGSTGRPKAAGIEHHSLVTLVNDPDYAQIDPDGGTVAAWISSFCYDIMVGELLLPLARGAATVLAEEEDLASPAAFNRFIAAGGVTRIALTPSRFDAYTAEPAHRAFLDRLEVLVLGGEELTPALARRAAAHPALALRNLYGPTETTVGVTTEAVADPEDITIGRPLRAASVYLLDGVEPVGIGMPGELCVAGPLVGRGYIGHDDLTAERFVPNPFGPGRLYRTGDLARWREDGRIEFRGRIDSQIQLRGVRVELGEVRAAIASVAGVRDAIVLTRGSGMDTEIVAHAVLDPAAPAPSAADIRERCAALLPRGLVPAAIGLTDEAPRTPSGKLDLAALPPLGPAEADAGAAPRDQLEADVAAAFQVTLGRPVGVLDDFFALGGHSLKAAALLNQVEAATGARLALRDVFSHPTPAALARLARERLARGGAAPEGPIRSAGGPGVYPLSPAARRQFALHQVDPDSLAYNQAVRIELGGPADPDRLAAAFQGLVDRHEALRTAFEIRGGEPVQIVAPPGAVRARLALLEPGEADGFVRPFDLAAPPLARLALEPGAAPALLFDAHHIVSDAGSLHTLVQEFAALAAGRALPPQAVHAKD